MIDCIDARIDQNIIAALKAMTHAAEYNTDCGTVERIRGNLEINNRYPFTLAIQMDPNENEEWGGLRDDALNYLIWYFDGKDDGGQVPDTEFVYRLRNVHADVTKALKLDPSRGGLAQNTKILRHGFGAFMDGNICEPGAWVLVEIERLVDSDDPYQLP